MSDDRGPAPPPPPPEPRPTASDAMVGGGIYFRWNDRLWQEQADGSYLVWDEATHQWETSTVQPPPQPGQTLATRECPNCGRRVKQSLRYCPFCEFGFEEPSIPTAVAPRPAPTVVPRRRRDRSTIVLLALLAMAVAGGIFVFQDRRAQACDNWKAAVEELTTATIDLRGLPPNTSEDELFRLNEDLLADRRPGGCE